MIATIVVFLTLTQEYTDSDRFGQSIDSVLAMGREGWHEWYTDGSRGSGSTMGETFAQMIFADCLKYKNDAHFLLAKDKRERLIRDIDASFGRTVENCVKAGMSLTGGGTMWNTIGAGAQATRQETVRDLIWKTKKMPGSSQTEVWKSWHKASKALDDNKSDIEVTAESGGLMFDQAKKHVYRVNDDFNVVVHKVKNQDESFKRRVFAFFKDMLELVTLGSEQEN